MSNVKTEEVVNNSIHPYREGEDIRLTLYYDKERVEELTDKSFTKKEWDYIKEELDDCSMCELYYESIDNIIMEHMDGIIEYGEQMNWNSDYIPS